MGGGASTLGSTSSYDPSGSCLSAFTALVAKSNFLCAPARNVETYSGDGSSARYHPLGVISHSDCGFS